MATLTAKLTLTSSDTGTSALDATTTSALAVTLPSADINRQSIATGSAQEIIASNSAFSYIYLKNVSGTGSNPWVQIKLGGDAKIKLRVGEFVFLPLYSSQVVAGEAQVGACTVEYGYWSVS
tara:strand:+ start:979 stop:1344 length:366 start_codon:yes stop_codon:yes gene_type:complete